MKVKEIKEFLKQFDDDDKVLIECCIKDCDDNTINDKEYRGAYKNEIINGEPFQIELCNYEIVDEYVEFMFMEKDY